MSFDIASATLVGNVAKDPELRYTATGKMVVNFTVAMTRKKKDEAGQWVDKGKPLFKDCTAWGLVAEAVVNNIKKGDPVIVLGHYEDSSYEVEVKDSQGNPVIDLETRTPIMKRVSADRVIVDTVGHDLRWGTARFERRSASQGYSGGAGAPAYQGQGPQGGSPAAGWGGGNYPAAGAAQPPQGAYGGASGGYSASAGFPPEPNTQGSPQANLQGGPPVSEPYEEEPPF